MTLLFFVDESADERFHYHVGVLGTGEQFAAAERDLDAVARHALQLGYGDSFTSAPELHGKDIHGGKGNWGALSYPQRYEVIESALAVLEAHGIEVLARGIELERFRERYGNSKERLHELAFRNLLERLCERLKERDELALVIADDHYTRSSLRRDVKNAKATSTTGYRATSFAAILDTVHFVDSAESRAVQLADMVAFVLRRRRSVPTEKHPEGEVAMARIADRVGCAVPDPTGRYHSVYYAQPRDLR